MARYFFDLDDGKTDYLDTIGTEIADPAQIQSEAVRFLASVFRDAACDVPDRVFLVSVRDGAGRVVLTTTLTLRSDWREAGYRFGTDAIKRPVVLIVENELQARMTAAELISENGYDVLEAENADSAIAIIEARPDIQVVFTDVRLPGSMDGLKFARYVRNRWPPIRIIATSASLTVRDHDLPAGGVFLPKPYSADRVVAALREFTATN